ncbi:DUF6482 family protein [Bowmanella sp. JS7-9]|uniref:DUF6482 family protein n=1 Tax=Pseudobowmanella zhangzhouensis TaxID=1537679 RepID=A0ABW1XIY6_9ALTE|nr:DUF6482 family protein [Bowmanella sp. JS7-9]
MKYYLSQLSPTQPIDQLTVLAHEMSLYLVKLSINGEEGILYAEDDRPMRFFNAMSIREAFSGFAVRESCMQHDTPYDEMIGNPQRPSSPVTLPFSIDTPY